MATKRGPVDPEQFIGYTVVRLSSHLQKRMEEALAELGITARQFSVLFHLARTPDISAGKLARLVLITPQSMSDLIASLTAAGLVERAERLGRGHPMGVRLTRAGEAALARAFPAVQALEERTTASLTRSEAKQLNDLLHRVIDDLEGSG